MVTWKNNKISCFFKTNDTFIHRIDECKVFIYIMETVRIQGSNRLTTKNKTQRLRWNISIQPIKNNVHSIKIIMI
jgi:hypothetical protein